MFGIEWLVGGSPVERGCVAGTREEAIAEGRRRAHEAARHRPDRAATKFRILDAAGETIGVFSVNA